jgi:hypothetical protein
MLLKAIVGEPDEIGADADDAHRENDHQKFLFSTSSVYGIFLIQICSIIAERFNLIEQREYHIFEKRWG